MESECHPRGGLVCYEKHLPSVNVLYIGASSQGLLCGVICGCVSSDWVQIVVLWQGLALDRLGIARYKYEDVRGVRARHAGSVVEGLGVRCGGWREVPLGAPRRAVLWWCGTPVVGACNGRWWGFGGPCRGCLVGVGGA